MNLEIMPIPVELDLVIAGVPLRYARAMIFYWKHDEYFHSRNGIAQKKCFCCDAKMDLKIRKLNTILAYTNALTWACPYCSYSESITLRGR